MCELNSFVIGKVEVAIIACVNFPTLLCQPVIHAAMNTVFKIDDIGVCLSVCIEKGKTEFSFHFFFTLFFFFLSNNLF